MSPAAAFAWEFRARHRWGLLVLGVYFVALVVVKGAFVLRGIPIKIDSPESFAFMVVIPVAVTATYVLAVFTYGLDGDIAGRQSMYPPRLFTRPVSNAALVNWPMLYGSAVMLVVWAALRAFALWPADFPVPVLWPGLLAVSLLAWTQALTWMPYPLPGMRIAAAAFALTFMDSIVMVELQYKASELTMLAILLPTIPMAYGVARYAIARARRGDMPRWQPFGSGAPTSPRSAVAAQRAAFGSASRAQEWFEWRSATRSLAVWVAILLPLEILLLPLAGTSIALVVILLLGMLATPSFMATFVGAQGVREGALLTATRPVSDAGLALAKLRASLRATIESWIVVFIAVPIGIKLTGEWPFVADRARAFAQLIGAPRAIALAAFVVILFVASTWKQLVQRLYIQLTGSESLIKGSAFAVLGLLFLVGPAWQWIVDRGQIGVVWMLIPWILLALVTLKMTAAALVAIKLWRARLVSDATLVGIAALWTGVVLAMHLFLNWLLATPHIAGYLLLMLAILFVPLARVSAAPLALARGRHR